MKRWQNKMVVIPGHVNGGKTRWDKHQVPNPEVAAILTRMLEGTYEPPEGWRLLAVDKTHDLTLLFEREIDGEPYR